MTIAEQLAEYVVGALFDDLSPSTRRQLKVRILDSLGCAIAAIDGEPIRIIREQLLDFGGAGPCTLIGGGRSAPDRAAFYNSACIRYLDLNDFYLAKHEACHPSDNLGSVMAASEYAGADGKTLMLGLALAYHVQCRLSDVAPVRAKGFDHTTQETFAVAAGVSKVLGLDAKRIAHAIALSGTPFNALRVTRTGDLSHWKGMASASSNLGATHATFLAMRGMTGPLAVFEGNKGFMEAISGPFEIDWSKEGLDRVEMTDIKRYNTEGHSQTAIEGLLELKDEHKFEVEDIDRVELDVFLAAYNIIGGGEEGAKKNIHTKEQADHSLPYMAAVALLDGPVMMAAYQPERILAPDVQGLLQRVHVFHDESLTERFPEEEPTNIRIFLKDGRVLRKKKNDYLGYHTNPTTWDAVAERFGLLTEPYLKTQSVQELQQAVSELESIRVEQLAALLAKAGKRTD